jgi:lipoprotein-anchoring transpeptidase ErfK/SrfK
MFVDFRARRRWLQAPIVLAVVSAVGLLFAAPAFAESAAEIEARTSPNVAGTPCTAAAAACVDVNKKQAWLIKDGKVARGPVAIATGGSGKDTPTGNVFRVYRKEKDFKSDEFKLPNGQPAPMPNAVFFEDGGIAFHAGSPQRASAGCVHLGVADSLAFFNFLNVGDHVQVMDGPVVAPKLSEISPASADASDDSNDPDAHSSARERDDPDEDGPRNHHGRHHGDY